MAHLATVTRTILFFALCHVTMSITIQEFFPDIKGNLTKLKWAHKTNSRNALIEAFNNTEILLIEADVIIGNLTGSNQINIPIMGHPPQIESDLSLDEFLVMVLSNKMKGIKLDFKSTTAFKEGVTTLKQYQQNLTQIPLFLNADILNGPENDTTEVVNATEFLTGAAEFPNAIISVGWTTRLEANSTTARYTSEQIENMLKLTSHVNQSITYPVRACFAANDVDGLNLLVKDNEKTTLTVWSSENDPLDANLLSSFIKRIGFEKVFLDVPASLFTKLDLSSNSAGSAQSSLLVMLCAVIVAIFKAKLL